MNKLAKLTQPLFLIVLIFGLLIFLKPFLIPLSYGFLIALILYPICKKIESKKISRTNAITITVFSISLILSLIIFLLFLQINNLNKVVPELLNRIEISILNSQNWIVNHLGFSIAKQDNFINETSDKLTSNLGNIITGTFSVASTTMMNLIIIPLYAILILNYRKALVDFLISLIPSKQKENLLTILSETIHIYFNYLKGMLWLYIIVGILNSIGLLILGVDYAILFGMGTAFMTIIPYIGIIISSVLPITMVWIETNNILYPLGVIAIFSFVQYLEATLIFPYIVGKQLNVNMLVSITTIFFGGVIWGLSGMILFLPFVALLKIISAHFEELKPLNKLLENPH